MRFDGGIYLTACHGPKRNASLPINYLQSSMESIEAIPLHTLVFAFCVSSFHAFAFIPFIVEMPDTRGQFKLSQLSQCSFVFARFIFTMAAIVLRLNGKGNGKHVKRGSDFELTKALQIYRSIFSSSCLSLLSLFLK